MASDKDVIASLSDALGASSVIDDPARLHRYSHDWSGDMAGRARCVIRPRDAAQVAAAVAICARHGVPMVPQGGHTGLVGGAIPSDDGTEVILSLERLNRVRAIDPLNFSLVAEAGCVLQAVRNAAEAQDLMFPLSLGAQGSCQIGGNVSTNAGGINVLRYGMTRDLVLGVSLADQEDVGHVQQRSMGRDREQRMKGDSHVRGDSRRRPGRSAASRSRPGRCCDRSGGQVEIRVGQGRCRRRLDAVFGC